jgi:hypothetical protein
LIEDIKVLLLRVDFLAASSLPSRRKIGVTRLLDISVALAVRGYGSPESPTDPG